MGKSYNYDGKISNGFTKIMDALVLGALWLACSLPIITVGASSTAFYYAFNKCVKERRGYTLKEFFHAFKTNFKQSTLIALIVIGMYILTFFDLFVMYVSLETMEVAKYLLIVFLFVLAFLTIWVLYLFPYIARFENKTKAVMKNCFLIMLANLPWSILLMVVFVISAMAFLVIPLISIAVPAIYMALANRILEHVFHKYMSSEDLESETEQN